MKGKHEQEEVERFSAMRGKIEEIERLILDLKELAMGCR